MDPRLKIVHWFIGSLVIGSLVSEVRITKNAGKRKEQSVFICVHLGLKHYRETLKQVQGDAILSLHIETDLSTTLHPLEMNLQKVRNDKTE